MLLVILMSEVDEYSSEIFAILDDSVVEFFYLFLIQKPNDVFFELT